MGRTVWAVRADGPGQRLTARPPPRFITNTCL